MFTAKQRQIYKFSYNGKVVAKDPVKLMRRMDLTRPPNFEQLETDLKSSNRLVVDHALDIFLEWIQQLFGVQPVDEDGNGLCEDDMFDLLKDFTAFVETQKKSGPEPPSSSPTTQESTPSGTESSAPTPNSDCGCTDPSSVT